jgi:hypothetical protein
MSEIDQMVLALAGYIAVSAVISFVISRAGETKKPIKVSGKNLIEEGKEAYCLVCNRSFFDDKQFDLHRNSKAHTEKLQKHSGDEYRIQKKKH